MTFRWKDYRARSKENAWIKTMTLAVDEFIRRFLIHVLPSGFHRIRHYGLLASGTRAAAIAHARDLLGVDPSATQESDQDQRVPGEPSKPAQPCPCCGGRMIVTETFGRTFTTRSRPASAFKVDTS